MKSVVAGFQKHSMRRFSRCSTSKTNSPGSMDQLDQFHEYCGIVVKLAVVVCLVSILQGCYPLVGVIKIQGDDEQQLSGVWESLKASSDLQPVRMLYIHGMGVYRSTNYVQPFASRLTQKLGLTLKACEKIPLQTEAKPPQFNGQLSHASISICSYVDSQKRTLLLYTVLWSPLTEGIKKAVLGYDSAENYVDDRAWLSKRMKKDVMNDSLSDPLLYLSPKYQLKLRLVMRQAICVVASRNDSCATLTPTIPVGQQNSAGLFIVTESLGSTMLYDVLREIYKEQVGLKEAGKKLISDSVAHYMFANQLPLLCLGRYSDAPDSEGWSCVTGVGTTKKDDGAELRDKRFRIVAFSDPNDLLSYPLEKQQFKDFAESNSVTVTNVLLHVEKWALVPGLAYPHTAHTGHRENADVLQIIACGITNKKPGECKPTPTLADEFRPFHH